jgi:hypothetical protein
MTEGLSVVVVYRVYTRYNKISPKKSPCPTLFYEEQGAFLVFNFQFIVFRSWHIRSYQASATVNSEL